ncbi:hypothetical protein ACP70R_017042 [Stipagrostis hirtigluma subsp. patula]
MGIVALGEVEGDGNMAANVHHLHLCSRRGGDGRRMRGLVWWDLCLARAGIGSIGGGGGRAGERGDGWGGFGGEKGVEVAESKVSVHGGGSVR